VLYEILEEIADRLTKGSLGAKTISIGIEDGISADDTPWVRIVPTEEEAGEFGKIDLSIEIYIGTDILDEMSQTYREHMEFIEKVKEILTYTQYGGGVCHYSGATFDKDIVKNFKVAALRFEIRGITA